MPGRDDQNGSHTRLGKASGSVRGRLVFLIVALVIMGGLVSAVVALDDYRDGRAATERHLAATANALSLAVDGRVEGMVDALEALAASPALAAGDLAVLDARARQGVPERDRWVMLADARGQMLMNTALPPGAALPSVPPDLFSEVREKMGRSNLWISDRLFPTVHGNVGVGVVTKVGFAGQPAYLCIGTGFEAPGEIMTRQGFPPDWHALLLDRDQRVISSAGRTRPPDPNAAADLVKHIRRNPDRGVVSDLRLEGRPILVAYRRSPYTGWTMVVGEPMADVNAPLIRSLVLIVGAVSGLLALGILLAFRLSRGVSKAVDVLARAAEGLGEGVYEGAAATGLRETDHVARAMRGASVRLSAREAELRLLNETLEARVAERTRELAAANERLAEAKKLEVVARITGGVAHDFNNLLTAVMGCFDLLGKRLTDESQKKLVAHGREAAERGAVLTRRLLAFGRRQRLEPAPLDLNALVEDTAALVSGTLGPGVGLRSELATGPLWVIADRSQLQDAIMSLASNARDAVPEAGGDVTIATGRASVQAQSSFGAPPPGEYAMLSVRDTGCGMAPEVAEQMWEPFFSTKGRGVGYGLGLSQVLGMARQSGGGVGVETAPGRGTRVSVYLPLARPAVSEPGAQAEPAATPSVDLAGCKVLLVDDDADVRWTTAALLADLGCVPEEADGGVEALARLQAGVPDVVVTDYCMPGMTGAELARRLAALYPNLPVLMISGYMDVEALERSWTGPVLAKPFDREALKRQLEQVLVRAQRSRGT